MRGHRKTYKNNPLLYILIVALLAVAVALAVYAFQISFTEKRNQFSTNIIECKKTEDDTEEKDETKQTISRTYRFFNYTTDTPDTYTTLKLGTKGKYFFFVNSCEGVIKYTGPFTETNTTIRLGGDIAIDFNKVDNGNSLTFDLAKAGVCQDSGGTFSLEQFILSED